MTNEFKIRFSYQNKSYNARVIRSESADCKTYAVRPFSLSLAKQFGPQTVIRKQNNLYSCESILSGTMPAYIQALVSGLKHRSRS